MYFLLFVLIPGIIAFYLMRKTKHELSEGQIDETTLTGKLFWYVVILETIAPVVSATIFYYGWKKRMPKKAKKANNVGWLIIIILVGLWIAYSTLIK